MRVALTGASGYVGSLLSKAMKGKGWEVLALSRRPCPEPWCSYALGDEPTQLPWSEVDILIHAAYDFKSLGWDEIFHGNTRPSIELFEAAHTAGIKKLIFISSISSFEGCHSYYGRSKLLVEKEVVKLGGLVIRPGLVWGRSPGGVMGAMEQAVIKLPVVPYISGPRQASQYMVHEEDLGNCVTKLCEKFPYGGIFNATHPMPVPMREIVQGICLRLKLRRILIPINWRFIYSCLRTAEICGMTPPFRSDSLIGLMYSNTEVDKQHLNFRPYT